MTDAERAEEYRKSLKQKLIDEDEFERLEMFDENVEEAYLAGLKAARQEMWHDLRKNPNDLPEIYMGVLNQNGMNVVYDYTNKVWRDDNATEYICDDRDSDTRRDHQLNQHEYRQQGENKYHLPTFPPLVWRHQFCCGTKRKAARGCRRYSLHPVRGGGYGERQRR